MVSASLRVSSRSASESPEAPSFSLSWCSSRCLIKSLIPTGRHYIGSGTGLQEDLARHLSSAVFAGAFLGEPAGPTAQERRHTRELLERPVGPRQPGHLRAGLRVRL